MKQFQLSKQPRGQTTTRFHVLGDDDSICGIITVPNEAADDLEKHWRGAAPQSRAAAAAVTPGGKQNPMVAAMINAARRNPSLSKQAILRGCH